MNKFLAVNRVAFTIAGTDIYWYGIIMCVAILTAICVATSFCKTKKYDSDIALATNVRIGNGKTKQTTFQR